jgi:UDP-3-O-[3-hydroxymyristoyl] glucosamine N-acyltransferase
MIALADVLQFLATVEPPPQLTIAASADVHTLTLHRPAPLPAAGPGEVAFCGATARDPAALLRTARPTLLLIDRGLGVDAAGLTGAIAVVAACDNARLTFARLLARFFAPPRPVGIHPTAVVAPTAQIGERAYIGPLCSIAEDVVVGDEAVLYAGVHVYARSRIGRRVTIHAGTVVGAAGFGYERGPAGELVPIPHLGGVVIEDDVEIGANTCIDRGTLADTIIGRGARIDNLVHLAHNTRVGRDAAVIAHAMIGGSTQIGDRAWIAPSACVRDRIRVGDDAVVGLAAVVTRPVADGETVFGSPARPEAEQRRVLAALGRLGADEPPRGR